MVKRGRPGIKPHIERLIGSRVLKDREKPRDEWTPRKALAFELQREIEGMGEPVPEISTLEKRISDYSKPLEEPDSQDKPWSMATLDKDPIPPETMPVVLKAYAAEYILLIEQGRPLLRPPLTIREALWVARLSSVLKDMPSLLTFAKAYANNERLYKVIDKPLDTSHLDSNLFCHLKDELCADLGVDSDSIKKAFPLIITEIEICNVSSGEIIEKIKLYKEEAK